MSTIGEGGIGSQGEIGFTGSQGDTGFTGSQGDIGFTGSQGDIGFTGSQGDTGFTGSQGDSANISNDTATNADSFFPMMTDNVTSGSTNSFVVSSSKMFYNPSTGTLSTTNYNSLSDITTKENIRPINGTHYLEQINPVGFNWKETGTKSYGVVAQELEEILPELVTQHGTKKYVNYIPLIAMLLESYKDLSRRIKDIEKDR